MLNQWVNQKLNTHNISMRKLAAEVGYSQSYVSKVLSGQRSPKLGFYIDVAEYFDATIELLTVAGIISPDGGDLELTEDENELVAEYRGLHPLGREAVRGLIKEFLERQGKYF